jgi:hypothetical protein
MLQYYENLHFVHAAYARISQDSDTEMPLALIKIFWLVFVINAQYVLRLSNPVSK